MTAGDRDALGEAAYRDAYDPQPAPRDLCEAQTRVELPELGPRLPGGRHHRVAQCDRLRGHYGPHYAPDAGSWYGDDDDWRGGPF